MFAKLLTAGIVHLNKITIFDVNFTTKKYEHIQLDLSQPTTKLWLKN